MNLTPDDPRLTAYALGELDEAGKAAIQSELEHLPECRQAVEEIRQAANMLAGGLTAEPCAALTTGEREVIVSNASTPVIVPLFRRGRILWASVAAAAACAVLLIVFIQSSPRSPGQIREGFDGGKKVVAPLAKAKPVATPSPQSRPTQPVVPATPPTVPQLPFDESEAIQPAPNTSINGTTTPIPMPVQETRVENNQSKSDSPEVANVTQFRMAEQPQPQAQVGVVNTGMNRQQMDLLKTQLAGTSQQGGGTLRLARTLSESQSAPGLSRPEPAIVTRPASPPVTVYRYSPQTAAPRAAGRIDSDYLQKDQRMFRRYGSEPAQKGNTAEYPHWAENRFLAPLQEPLSTFSIDVDTASYANVRRFLNAGELPPEDAVRIEEMINYFSYHYPRPRGDEPFSASMEAAGCPWSPEHRLVRIGIKGRELAEDRRPPSNFVFLIDVSGSMEPAERLPLIKQALRQLVKKMTDTDRVAIVTYASSSGVVLESTSCSRKEKILEAIDALNAGGSTNGGEGIRDAYRTARTNFLKEGNNRVILCTDGDFNVGITDRSELVNMIQENAKSGVFLTTIGVGNDNYKDALMQQLADKGNGNYFYFDSFEEAQKVLIQQMNSTLVTIARDVKIQVEFNPAQVAAYRLIGYEKRVMPAEDFNNDAKDGGEIGAGHTITALYEVIPVGAEYSEVVDGLKYQQPAPAPPRRSPSGSKEMLTLKLRYQPPEGGKSKLLEFSLTDTGASFARASDDFRFAAAVVEFGSLLKNSQYKGSASCSGILEMARDAKGSDPEGYRSEFLNLVQKADRLVSPRYSDRTDGNPKQPRLR